MAKSNENESFIFGAADRVMLNWFLIREWFVYFMKARGMRSIHSPFVFDFMQHVLYDERVFYCYEEIELLRERMMLSEEVITITDAGAGSKVMKGQARKIRSIVKHASTPSKYAQLLFRIGNYYGCKNFLELGTSLGLTTMYLASVSNEGKVITLEGDPAVAAIAAKNFESINKRPIEIREGLFTETLPEALKALSEVDLAYVDGHHLKAPTVNYFESILPFTHNDSVVVIGDIHWSAEMKQAWKQIISNPKVTVSIDLFQTGIVFFRKESSRQHLVLRY